MSIKTNWRKRFDSENLLFDGDDRVFKEIVGSSSLYGEFGSGASTTWVLKNTQSRVVSVETSVAWADQVQKQNETYKDRLKVWTFDFGPTAEWGYPLTYQRRDKFHAYPMCFLDNGLIPDILLIDGRFRVACLLAWLTYATPDCVVLFDDYKNRPWYHVVEEYIEPAKFCGRQALFRRCDAKEYDINTLQKELGSFCFVMT